MSSTYSSPSILQTGIHQLAWGGAEEREEEKAAGNAYAKDWQDEARKLLECMVRILYATYFHIYG